MFSTIITFSQILRSKIPGKLVVLTFDDAAASHYNFVAPLLKKYGFEATFYVCEFPPDYADSTKYMTWSQIQQLGKMGFEIGNHTRSHAHISKLNKSQITNELNYIERKCDSLHVNYPVTFAYPGYDLNKDIFPILQKRGYLFARAGGSRLYNPIKDHPYLIPSWASTANNKSQIFEALQNAKNGKIVVLTFHGVPDYAHEWVSTPQNIFTELMRYLYKYHFKVINMRSLSKYINANIAIKKIIPDFELPLRN